MKNKLIKDYRERLENITKDRKGSRSFIEANIKAIEDCYNKFYEIERPKNFVEYNYKIGKLEAINKESLFIYSDKKEKIYLLKTRNITKEIIKRQLDIANKQLDAYRFRIFDLSELVQLEINKLELLEETFYKLCYTIEYLELGEKAIEINNDIKYSYFFTKYCNGFTGFESSHEKLKPVFFTEEDIIKFIYENENSFV